MTLANYKGMYFVSRRLIFMLRKPQSALTSFIPISLPEKSSYQKVGVLIAIKNSVSFQLHTIIIDPHGRYPILVCDLKNTIYTIVNLFAPCMGQLPFLKALLRIEIATEQEKSMMYL